MPSSPEVITRSPSATSDRFDTYSMRSGASPSAPTTTPPAPLRSMNAPAPALRSMISCTLAACAAGSSMTRPTTPSGDSTAMSRRTPSLAPLSMVTVRNGAAGSARDHPRRHRRRQFGALQLQQLLELLGAAGLRVGVLQFDAEAIELQLQGVGAGAVPLRAT